MSDEKPPLTLLQGGIAKNSHAERVMATAPSPPPSANLSVPGRRVWDYVCTSLIEAGIDISTSGFSLLLITRMYLDWIEDIKLCETDGRYGTSKKGGQYEYPHSYNEKKLRKELQDCLPANCLTAMSLVEARVKQARAGDNRQLDLLFDDLVNHATADRRNTPQS